MSQLTRFIEQIDFVGDKQLVNATVFFVIYKTGLKLLDINKRSDAYRF